MMMKVMLHNKVAIVMRLLISLNTAAYENKQQNFPFSFSCILAVIT